MIRGFDSYRDSTAAGGGIIPAGRKGLLLALLLVLLLLVLGGDFMEEEEARGEARGLTPGRAPWKGRRELWLLFLDFEEEEGEPTLKLDIRPRNVAVVDTEDGEDGRRAVVVGVLVGPVVVVVVALSLAGRNGCPAAR